MKSFTKRQETVLQGHTSSVLTVAVTSDNKYIVSGSDDNTIRIWNLLEKRQETVFRGHTDSVNSVAMTSDNKYIISGSDDNTIRIWKFGIKDKSILNFNFYTECSS